MWYFLLGVYREGRTDIYSISEHCLPTNKPITCCSVTRMGFSAHAGAVQQARSPSTERELSLAAAEKSVPPGFHQHFSPHWWENSGCDKSCIYCTNTALSGSTLTHSSVCVRTEGDPFQLLCVGVCQQCSWRQSPLWRPVFRIDTGPRSACSQGPTWGLMNNGERILRAKRAYKSDLPHYQPKLALYGSR